LGSAPPMKGRTITPLAQRFWSKVDRSNGCWIWRGTRSDGYGMIRVEGKMRGAHRVAIYLNTGVWPESDVDHLCRNRACVNPAHIEVVTHRENVHRGMGTAGVNARKTHCIRGHEFTPENTYINPGRPFRACRACRRLRTAISKKGAKIE
jgi:hypothetical protein